MNINKAVFLKNNILLIDTMSITLALTGNSSVLSAEYFPPIELSGEYSCGLVDFHTYNSIPNVDVENNLLTIGRYSIEVPVGSYEIDDLDEYFQRQLKTLDSKIYFSLKANNNTLQTEIKSSETVYFNHQRAIGSLLGFSKRELEPNIKHVSDQPVNVIKVNAICVECNIITGSYINSKQGHTLHEFSPGVAPGYKIVEVPANVIYLPVNAKRLSSITLKITDQEGNLVNFRGETITIRLHLKPRDANL